MTVGTAFHSRTAPLNRKLEWREWSGYHAASVYADHHDIEYNAIREAAALTDVSPLFKYRVTGRDAMRLIDRVITRDATKLAVGQVYYTCWCDEHGKVVDDGTVARIDDTTYRWTAANPSLRWFEHNAAGLDVDIEETTETEAALALQGPRARDVLEAATGESFEPLRYFRCRRSSVGDVDLDVSRTGYTGDLGYELWVDAARALDLWDRLTEAGRPFGLRPAGLLALDVARLEAGLILIDVDFTSSRYALIAQQTYSPFEINLGWTVSLKKGPFIGRSALEAEVARGGPARRLVGLEMSWDDLEALYMKWDLPPTMPPTAWRTPIPVYSSGRQIGRATSGTWSPTLKKNIALASVASRHAAEGAQLEVEWTIEAHRSTVSARVVGLPFFDPPRKRA